MPFRFRRIANELVVDLNGALTFHQHQEAEQLVYQITALTDKGEVTQVRLNVAAVQRMDSHWLGIFIRILRRVKEKDANFIIEKPNHDLSHLFTMVELGRIAEIRA